MDCKPKMICLTVVQGNTVVNMLNMARTNGLYFSTNKHIQKSMAGYNLRNIFGFVIEQDKSASKDLAYTGCRITVDQTLRLQ